MNIIILSTILCLCAATSKAQVPTDMSSVACYKRMAFVWLAAQSYQLESRAQPDFKITISILTNYIPPMEIFCPLNRRLYPDFSVQNGPTCFNGHSIGLTNAIDSRIALRVLRLVADLNEIKQLAISDAVALRRVVMYRCSALYNVDSNAIAQVVSIGLKDVDVLARRLALDSIVALPKFDAWDDLVACLEDDKSIIRIEALSVINRLHTRLNNSRVVWRVLLMVDDEDRIVADAAHQVLVKLANKDLGRVSMNWKSWFEEAYK